MFDAAIEGYGPNYERYAYFFIGPSYIAYDWEAGRVSDFHPRPLSDWGLPPPFDQGINAALAGDGAFTGTAYFFRGWQYAAYSWNGNTTSGPRPNTEWNLPAGFATGFDAAWSGRHGRVGNGYFLKGPDYLRYLWKDNRIMAGYPKWFAEREVQGIPGWVDAAVNGHGDLADYAYFFQDGRWSSMNWKTLKGDTPHQEVFRTWPGLAEVAAVEPARRMALGWITAAQTALTLLGSAWPPADPVLATALRTHFHIGDVATAATHLGTIRSRYSQLRTRLETIGDVLRWRTMPEAAADGQPDVTGYTYGGGTLNITERLLRKSDGRYTSPQYQAAIIQHESGHQIGMPDHAYEGDHANYDALTPDKAAENTSSYVAFAQHIHERADVRWGGTDPQAPHP